MHYDVIIPVSYQDVSFIPKVVAFIRKNLIGVSEIFVITSKQHFKYLKKLHDYITLVDEDSLISGLSYSSINEILKSKSIHNRTGWYFQQLLKFAFAQSRYAHDYYLSWDADTLPLSKISFFEGEHPLFTPKKEFHQPYFITLNKLLNLKKIVDFSFIAEHMLFKKEYVTELIDSITHSNVEGGTWYEKILNACDFSCGSSFSEFETYGTYVWHTHPNVYKTRFLNTFRGAGFIKGRLIDDKTLESISIDLDIASFELRDEPVFPYNIPNIKYKWIRRLKKILSKFNNRI